VGGFTIISTRERISRAYDVRGLLTVLVLAVVYLIVAGLGMTFADIRERMSPVWPASGLALAALLVLGVRRWPGISLGTFGLCMLAGAPVLASLGMAAGNTLEAVLGALLLRRLGFSLSLERVRDVVALIIGPALGCSLVSALVGSGSLVLFASPTWDDFPRYAEVWWGAAAMGVVVVTPALLLLRQWQLTERRLEAAALGVGTLLICLEVFRGGLMGFPIQYVEAFLFFPLAVWGALRFGTRGAAFTTLVLTTLSIWGTRQGQGPFGSEYIDGDEAGALLLVQLFIAINAITGLLLAAVSAGRRDAVMQLELLATAVRGLSEGVVISEVTPQGPRVVFANEAFRALTGRPLSELLGRAPHEQIGELDPETHQRLQLALRESGPFRGQVLLLRQDGTRVHSELQISPVKEAGGAVTHMVSIHRDVTDTQELRARLVAAERVAAMGTVAAGVGHEINNPLAYLELGLGSAARSLGQGAKGIPGALAGIQEAQEGAERIRLIVQDLGMFTREGGENHMPVDLREVVTLALRMTRHVLRNRARLIEDFGPIPRVQGSEARLGQVLLNLVVNAMQAIPEGEPGRYEVRVRTSTAPDGRARVEVSDTGRGIPPEVIPHIFEPFFTTKSSGEGTGLGLSICRQIVRAHRGEILVHSEPGKGSVFTVLLPAAPAEVVRAVPEPPRVEQASSTPNVARRGRILIIDDEPRLAQSMRMLLEPNHDVVTTTRGSEALELVSAGQRFDVVVCDLQMPETTGMDIYARLREQEPELARRLVFISGGAYTSAARDFIRTVPNQVLEKPVRPDVLLATIDKAMAPALSRVSPGALP
jgi:PAS domain S-box-containing protein